MNAMRLCTLLTAAWAEHAFPAEAHPEEAVKAAFVLRFAGYIEWPPQAVADDHFRIAVLGANEVAQHLQTLAAGHSVMNRPVQVRRITSMRELGSAQVVYVGAARRGSMREVLAQLSARNVLVISDEERALEAGSVINLRVVDKHVRFEVSLPAARKSQLKISSELLALAVRVLK